MDICIRLQDYIITVASKVIRISQENYDKIVEQGDMTKTFDQVLSKIMEISDIVRLKTEEGEFLLSKGTIIT